MGRIILVLAGLIALCCVVLYAVFLRAPMIERDIETRTRQLLEASGLEGQVRVEADGRELLLSGDTVVKEQAMDIAANVDGAVAATWLGDSGMQQSSSENSTPNVTQPVVAADWATRLQIENGKLSITGDRPVLDGVSNAIVARLSAEFGGQNVSMNSQSARELPVYWADTVNAAAKALSKMQSGSAEVKHNKLSIEGVVTSESDQSSIKQMLVELTPSDVVWRTEFDTLASGAELSAQLLSPAQCDADVADYMTGKQVQFRKSKTSLQDNAFAVIDGVIQILVRCPSAKVQIGGYTDSRGDSDLNMRLSRERAETVRDYLVEQGINTARLDARGFGPQRPIASNKTAAGRAVNRRIEFRVIGE